MLQAQAANCQGSDPGSGAAMALNLPLKKISTEPGIPRAYTAVVYKEGSHVYAKDEKGSIICQDSPTACLQESVNYLAQFGGGRIFIRRGVYNITGPGSYLPSGEPVIVNIPYGIKLVIEGEGSNTVIKHTLGYHLFIHLHHDIYNKSWTSELIFRNFKIDRSQASVFRWMITVNYAGKFIVDGIEYEGVLSGTQPNFEGDIVIQGINNIYAEVKNCRLRGAKYAVSVFAYNSHIHDNYGELLAQEGFSGAGLLPNFSLPPGFTPGGVTVIENNACVDCALNEAAYAVDYGDNNPFIPNSIGIIRNNIFQTINYTALNPIGAVNVDTLIIEGNRIIGDIGVAFSVSSADKIYIKKNHVSMTGQPVATYNQAYVLTWGGPSNNPTLIDFSDNYIDATMSSSTGYPAFYPFGTVDTFLIRNNVINFTYNYNKDMGAIINAYMGVARFVFEGNIVKANNTNNKNIGTLIHISEVPTLYVRVRNNRVSINYTDYPGALIAINMNNSYTDADVPFVDVSNNYVYNTVNAGHVVVLNFKGSANLLYLKLRRNLTRNMSSQAYINVIDSGLTPTIIVDSELDNPLANLPSGVTLKFLRSSKGVATIAANTTAVTVNHGLVCTPSKVLVTPLGQPSGSIWVSNITATSFNINVSTAPTANLPIAWYAEC
jgi:hypothetical protein